MDLRPEMKTASQKTMADKMADMEALNPGIMARKIEQLKAADPEVARRIMELNQLKTDMIEDPDPIEKMEKMQLLYTEGESMQVPSTRLRGRPAFEKAVPIRQRR